MTREDKHNRFDELRNIALDCKKTRNLIKEKNDTIDKLNHNQKSGYFEPEPNLTPKDDLNLPKEKQLSDEFKKSQKGHIEQTRDDYDKNIYDSIREDLNEKEFSEHLEQIEELDKQEVSLLLEEDGANKLLDYQEEKEQEKQAVQKEDKKDLVTQMDEKESRDFWQENKSDIEQSKNEKDLSITLNQDDKTLDTIQLDEEQYDDLMSSPNYIDIEEKDIEVDMDKSPPEPSDNLE